MKSTAENMHLCEQRINEKIQAGITVEEWCKRNGMSKHQYNYWNHRVLKKQKLGAEAPFDEVTSILSSSSPKVKDFVHSTGFQIIINDIQVIVRADFHPEVLAGLVKVLRTV